jgi:ribosome-associated protein YbcJ (S4-like RNA binding protein)
MSKTRLDVLLTERGLFESREKAKAAIMAGVVFVNGQRGDKAGMTYDPECEIEVRGGTNEFVSRGGYKLKKALSEFDVSPEGKICIDCGASTGGFTDCLLKNGAAKVYSIEWATVSLRGVSGTTAGGIHGTDKHQARHRRADTGQGGACSYRRVVYQPEAGAPVIRKLLSTPARWSAS